MSRNRVCHDALEDQPGVETVDGRRVLNFDMFRIRDAEKMYSYHVDDLDVVPPCLSFDRLRHNCGFEYTSPLGYDIDTKESTIKDFVADMRASLRDDMVSRGWMCSDRHLTTVLSDGDSGLTEQEVLTAFRKAGVKPTTRNCPHNKHTGHINDIFKLQTELCHTYQSALDECRRQYPGSRRTSAGSAVSATELESVVSSSAETDTGEPTGSGEPSTSSATEEHSSHQDVGWRPARRFAR